ncbi:CRISPR-associated endonuclease Cas1, subtype I-C/DVULG [Selenomonas sp. FOBRC6]|uniref:type I-C CRISPR-associated endonuclease Cas1c n=1 Tax=Selenomonas sp. FOBRC6 TaxID=936572 RepID=UPI0002781EBF|nr:type I-C CRISPR-associated endonuclease Cas1c [Selenomonas sp. FOBRC6]EJO19223.1 CRISPR-associated endonuclease Cas1, subtype I-C/DVULG [Selenomonas sp. FOBRC6]
MKPLLNTLFVNQDEAYLALDGGNVVVLREDRELARFPLHNFEQITSFGYTGASPALMRKCAEDNIALTFMTPEGRFQARVIGRTNGNVLLRREQYRRADDEEASLILARSFILGKIYNARWIIERMRRDHAMRIDEEKFQNVSAFLQNSCREVMQTSDLETLRGVEGKAAVSYFSAFDDMLLKQKEQFFFTERNRRPPLDNMNCLLSFLYALLMNDVGAAVEGVGLDSYVGFLHRDRPGRQSLALDLMEELRPLADRTAFSMVNTKKINGKDFRLEEGGAVYLTDDGRKKIIEAWHAHKEGMMTHPFLEEKLKWGLVPHVQALLLARYLRGDLDAYPPFLWK